jgi:glycosyltransferase involved in cell wall biosynthesis
MAAGTPVVISDIPVFHEVGGDVALYFGHDDPAGLARAVLALEAPGEWQRRSTLAYDRATEFTWARSAQTLLELARSLTEDR